MQKFEDVYAAIGDAIVKDGSAPGFELGEVLLEVNLKAALAGAELLIGLSVQSMVITLAVIAVLLWVERGCFSPLIPYSSWH